MTALQGVGETRRLALASFVMFFADLHRLVPPTGTAFFALKQFNRGMGVLTPAVANLYDVPAA